MTKISAHVDDLANVEVFNSDTGVVYTPPFIRTAYMPSYRASDIDFSDTVSLTRQADAPMCDINNIMAQYEKTGMVEHTNRYQGSYGDLGDSIDFHNSMNLVLAAQDAFESLPAQIRARFNNDPGSFLDFVSDPSNRDEMARMGLLEGSALAEVSSSSPASVGPQEAAEGDGEVTAKGGQ